MTIKMTNIRIRISCNAQNGKKGIRKPSLDGKSLKYNKIIATDPSVPDKLNYNWLAIDSLARKMRME